MPWTSAAPVQDFLFGSVFLAGLVAGAFFVSAGFVVGLVVGFLASAFFGSGFLAGAAGWGGSGFSIVQVTCVGCGAPVTVPVIVGSNRITCHGEPMAAMSALA